MNAVIGDLIAEYWQRPGPGAELPVLTLTEHNGFVRQTDRFHKRLATTDTSKYKVVRRDDIAFNPYLLWAGAVARNTIVEEGIISPLYPTFRVLDGFDPGYVARALLSPEMVSLYDSIAFGSVPRRRRSSVSDFLALGLPWSPPDLGKQRRVAAILDHSEALCVRHRQVLASLDALTQAIFSEMFDQHDHPTVAAREFMPEMRNGLSPSTGGHCLSSVLTLTAVTNGEFDPRFVKRGSFDFDPPPEKRVMAGEFLMCRGNGRLGLVGVGVAVRSDRPDLVFPDTVISGRVDQSQVLLDYLEVAWRQSSSRSQIESVARTTNGTYKVNQATLSGVKVPVPPMKLQREFANRLAGVSRQRAKAHRISTESDTLFASIQSRAFRGEL